MGVTVKVADLKKKIIDLEKDEIEYVDISFSESEIFEDELIPASISFEGYDGHYGGIDYESISHIEIHAGYKSNDECEHCRLQEVCDNANDDEIVCLMH